MRFLAGFLLSIALICAQQAHPAFEVASVMADNSGPVMRRGLLADRFQLKFHRETRQIKMRVLLVSKGGPKFEASKDQDQNECVNIRPTEISGVAIPFGHFVTILEAQLGYPMINETGLSGKYDLALKDVRDDSFGADGPSVLAALGDLGLKLETRHAHADVFVTDSAERPRGN